MTYRIFADTNVYLDFLMQRGKEWECAKEIFALAERGTLEVVTSASSLINIMYVMNTYKLTRTEIVENTKAILSYTQLVNPDNITVEIVLSSEFKDLEDAVQYYTALEVKNIRYFITSNIKDYKSIGALLPVLTPSAFMNMFKKENS
jgi:predicted nucleic acid-binding protein